MFNINKMYNFTTIHAAILGATYTNMKVIGIVAVDEAMKHSDVITKHESMKLAIGTLPVSASNLTYIIFTDGAGVEMVMALEYIVANSIVLVTTTNLVINVFNVDSTTESILRLRFQELGITNFTIGVA